MKQPVKKGRICVPMVLILIFGVGAGLSASTAADYATEANSIAVLLSDATGLPYGQHISLVVSETLEMRQVIADDMALTIPGMSADPATRRNAYSAVQVCAVRYSLQRRKLFVCPPALDTGRILADVSDSQFAEVLRLIFMNELARALLDQNYDLCGRFKTNRNPGNAAVLRGLMEGYCAYWTDWLSARSGSEDDIRRLAQSWASGRLARPDPAVYPPFDDPDPLRTLGRHFISSLNRCEGFWALQKVFMDPPRSIMDFFDPDAFLSRAEKLDPDHRRMKGILLDAAAAIGAGGNGMSPEQPSRILRKFAITPRLLDPPAIGLGLHQSDEACGTEVFLLVIRTPAIAETPLDSLIKGAMRPIRDITRLSGTRLEPGSNTLVVSKAGQMAIQSGRLIDSGNTAGLVYAAAGQWGPWLLLISARGNLRDFHDVVQSLQQLPSHLAAILPGG